MNPYFLETEMERRQTELRQAVERSRRAADLLTALLRSWRPGRHRAAGRPAPAGSVAASRA